MSYLGPSLRRRSGRRTSPWRRAGVALAISLLLNAALLSRIDVSWLRPPVKGPERDVELTPLTAEQWAANRAVRRDAAPANRAAPRPVLPPTPEPPPPRQMPGQVVDVAPSKNATPPKDSRFVSEHDSSVEKETRSRDARAGYASTLPKPSDPKATPNQAQPQPAPPVASRAGQRGGEAPAGRAGAPKGPVAPPAASPRDRLALAPGPSADVPRPTEQPGTRPGELTPPGAAGGPGGAGGEGGERQPGELERLNLRPSAGAYDKIAGGPAPDHLEGIEEGEGTYLNTREWKYAGYFNRIKQSVAAEWRPGPAMQARDPTGAKFGYKEWHTLLSVRLDSNGALKGVDVARTSGLEFLDRTAIEAFQRAQPFVNPPAGLTDARGEIAFNFGFYFDVGSPGLRLFRAPGAGP